ncbi:sodium:alanine symporter family protein [Oscillospiraceae bacterium PP1C4]
MEHLVRMITDINSMINGFVWGPVMISFMMLVGIYFTIGTGFFQVRKFGMWMNSTFFAIFKNKDVHDKRDPNSISQFQALSTALAGTIGTGNIVGVATAIVSGGVGAIFWMWVSAFLGMMTKYAENVLGNHYRYKNEKGAWVGGPMIYIERGLQCKWLAVLFSLFCMIASFGIGNMTQANSIAGALESSLHIAPLATGILVALFTGLVVLGGIKRIASVAEKFVPFMALFYTFGSISIIGMNYQQIPAAFDSIITEAFSLKSIGGGVGGYVMMNAIRFGVARGVFSNEAGLGSSVIVNSASNVKEPVQQGMWGIFEVFADTIIMCTLTALCIITSGVHLTGAEGAALSIAAFSSGFGSFGSIFVTIAITFFAFSTILGWSYYGERALEYLFGTKPVMLYKILFICMTAVGCVANLKLVWSISDTFNGLMAIPNLLAVVFLSGKVFSITRDYMKRRRAGMIK